jgi:hypothetical protein
MRIVAPRDEDGAAVPPPPPGPGGLSRRDYLAAHAPIRREDVVRCYGCEPNLNNDGERRAYFAVWALLAVEYADVLGRTLDDPAFLMGGDLG